MYMYIVYIVYMYIVQYIVIIMWFVTFVILFSNMYMLFIIMAVDNTKDKHL